MHKAFCYVTPGPEALDKIQAIRKAFSDAMDAVLANAPAGRERSVAVTQLETAAMWAVKAVTHSEPA